MGSLLAFAVLVFGLTLIGADVPTNISPNVVYYNVKNTTQGSVFQQNVVSSLDFITKQAPLNNGSADYKLGNGSDTVWSQGECYKLAEESCSTCLGSARDEMKQKAPLPVGVGLWINNTAQRCYLHYWQNNTFAQAPTPAPSAPAPAPAPPLGIDIAPNVIYWNTMNAENGSIYMRNVDAVVGHLLENTPSNGSASYRYGEYPNKVYMSQFCESCLQRARQQLQIVAPLAVGGQYWANTTTDRCFFRFENYKFLADPPVSAPTPPPLSPAPGVSSPQIRDDSSTKKQVVLGVSFGAAAVLVLVLCGTFILSFVKRGSHQKPNVQPFMGDVEVERSHEGPQVFKLQELKAATKNFSDEHKLGRGGFGAVYKVCELI